MYTYIAYIGTHMDFKPVHSSTVVLVLGRPTFPHAEIRIACSTMDDVWRHSCNHATRGIWWSCERHCIVQLTNTRRSRSLNSSWAFVWTYYYIWFEDTVCQYMSLDISSHSSRGSDLRRSAFSDMTQREHKSGSVLCTVKACQGTFLHRLVVIMFVIRSIKTGTWSISWSSWMRFHGLLAAKGAWPLARQLYSWIPLRIRDPSNGESELQSPRMRKESPIGLYQHGGLSMIR